MADIRIIPSIGAINITGSAEFRGTSGTSLLYLSGSGLIGAGTTNPQSEFHVVSSGTRFFTLDRSGTRSWDLGVNSSGTFLVTDNTTSADRLAITLSGSVGIGTTNPSYGLHVVSTVNEAVAKFRGLNDTTIIIGGADAGGSGEQYITYQNTTTAGNAWLVGMDDDEKFKFAYGGQGEITDEKAKMVIQQDGVIKFNAYGSGTNSGSAAYSLTVDSSGNIIESTLATINGSGTANYIPKWSDSDTLTDSAIYQDANGNIGINTTSPSQKLDVVGNIELGGGGNKWILTDETDTGTGRLGIQAGAGSAAYGGSIFLYANSHSVHPGDVVAGISSGTNGAFRVNTHGTDTGTDLFYVGGSSGNVGIGTVNPYTRTHIYTGTDITTVSDEGKYGLWVSQTNALKSVIIGYSDTFNAGIIDAVHTGVAWKNLILKPNPGNVGIGTTSPSYKLDVNGNAKFASDVYFYNTVLDVASNFATQRGAGFKASTGKFEIASSETALELSRFNTTGTVLSIRHSGSQVSSLNTDGGAWFSGDVEVGGDLTVDGIITAKEFHTTFVSASIIYQSGSTQFGNSSDDTHTLSGSLIVKSYDGNYNIRIEGGNEFNFYSDSSKTATTAYINYSSGNTVISQNLKIVKGTAGATGNVIIDANGNVGIGTAAPGNFSGLSFSEPLLDVSGSINIRGNAADTVAILNIGGDTYRKAAIYTSIGSETPYLSLAVGTSGTASSTSQRLLISSTGAIKFNAYGSGNNTGTQAYNLAVDSSGNIIETGISIDGSGTANYIPKWSDSDTLTNSVIYQNANGNIGIGTTDPAQKLSIYGNIYQRTGDYITWNNGDAQIGAVGGYALAFSTYTGATMTEKLRITSNGNVGIGSTAPEGKLNVVGGADVLIVEGSGSTSNTTIMAVDGNNGRLFEVSDDLSDSLFSVNTIAGLPVMEAFADNRVVLGAYNQNDLYITGSRVGIGTSAPEGKLHILGNFDANNPKQLIIASREDAGSVYSGIQFERAGGGTFFGLGNDSRTDRDEILLGGGFGSVVNATAFRVFTGTRGSTIGTERLTVISDGNVGIGTNSPAADLHVSGGVYIEGNNPSIKTEYHDNYTPLAVYQAGTRQWQIDSVSGDFRLYMDNPANAYVFNVTDDGNVGIGLTNPGYVLDTVGSPVRHTRSGKSIIINPNYGSADINADLQTDSGMDLTLSPAGTERVRVTTSGSVGVGTTAPTARLHVTQGFTSTNLAFAAGTTAYAIANRQYDTAVIQQDDVTTLRLVERIDGSNSDQVMTLTIGDNYGKIATSKQPLQFFVSGSSTGLGYQGLSGNLAMHMALDGNIGVGTSSPAYKLQVNGNLKATGITSTDSISVIHSAGLGFYSGPSSFQSFGSGVSTILLQGTTSNGRAGALWFKGYQGDDVAALYVTDDTQDNYGTTLTAYSGSIRFATQTLAGAKMIITSGGSVGVGTTSPTGKFNSYITATRQVSHNGNGGDLAVISDNNSTPVFYVKGTGTADLVNIVDNTSEVFTILDGGNVGIGTSSPSALLEVSGSTSDGRYIKMHGGTMGHSLEIVDRSGYTTSTANIYIQDADSNNARAIIRATGNNGNTEALWVGSDGKVGIGTTSPSTDLHIGNGGSSKNILLQSNGGGGTLRFYDSVNDSSGDRYQYIGHLDTTQRLQFSATGSGAVAMSITPAGSVGIGTTSPEYKLEVAASTIKPTSDLLLGEAAYSTSTSYIGLKTTFQTGVNDYMIISGKSDGNTYVSAKDGASVFIRGGGNLSSNQIFVPDSNYINIDTATLNVNGALTVDDGVTIGGDLTVDGIITAKEFHTTFVSASIIYQSGSTQFGNSSDDTHTLSGSLIVKSYDGNYAIKAELGDQLNFRNGASAATAYIQYAGPGHTLLGRNLFVEGNSSGGVTGAVRVTSDGNVGIGITNPSHNLYVNGSARASILHLPDGGDIAWNGGYASNNPVFASNGNEMRMYPNGASSGLHFALSNTRGYFAGSLGVGTSSPAAKLHVVGDISGSGEVRVQNGYFNPQSADVNGINVQPPTSGDKAVIYVNRGYGSHKGSGLYIVGANYTNNNNQAFVELNAGSYSGTDTRYIHAYDSAGTDFVVYGDGTVVAGKYQLTENAAKHPSSSFQSPQEIIAAGLDEGNGLYYINPGGHLAAPIQVYVDFTTPDAQGETGWMLVASFDTDYNWGADTTSTAAVLGTSAVNAFSANFGNYVVNDFRVHAAPSVDSGGTDSSGDWYYHRNGGIEWKKWWSPSNSGLYPRSTTINPSIRDGLIGFDYSHNIKFNYKNSAHKSNGLSDAAGSVAYWDVLTTAGNTMSIYSLASDGTLGWSHNLSNTGQDVTNQNSIVGRDDGSTVAAYGDTATSVGVGNGTGGTGDSTKLWLWVKGKTVRGGWTDGDDYVYTENTGSKVGIGTRTPTATLHLDATDGANIRLQRTSASTNRFDMGTDGTNMEFNVRDSGAFTFNGGNVGIGLTNPSRKFVVSGTENNEWIATFTNNGTTPYGVYVDTSNQAGTQYSFATYTNAGTGFFVLNDGKVGIGTSAPADKLEIVTGTYTKIKTFFEGSYTSGIKFSDYYGGIRYEANVDRLVLFANYPGAGAPEITFETSGSERMRIQADGNVGIGLTSPSARLDIASKEGANDEKLQRWTYYAPSPSAYYLDLKQTVTSNVVRYNFSMVNASTAYNDVLVLDRGNVGIGQTNPAYKLHVEGDAGVGANNAFKARYTTSDSYHGSFRWAGLQLGNNGSNRIVAGRTNTGGYLDFWVNNTNDASDYSVTPDGTRALTLYANATAGFTAGVSAPSFTGSLQGNITGTAASETLATVTGRGSVTSTPIRIESGATGLAGYMSVGNSTEAAGNYSAYFFGNTASDTEYFKGGIAYETLASTYGRGNMHFIQNSAADGTNASLSDTVMTILNGGYVGIGESSPNTPLYVQGGSAGSGGWNRTATLSATYPALIFNSNATKWGGMAYDYSAAMRFWVNAGSNDIFAGTLAMSILNNGNVGIGTGDPATKLAIQASADASLFTIRTSYSGNAAIVDAGQTGADGYLQVKSAVGTVYSSLSGYSGTPSYFMTNVGIGITNPSAKLEVVGDTYLRTTVFTDTIRPYTGDQLTLLNAGSNYVYVNGKMGIGNNSPTAPLSFEDSAQTRKIVLWDGAANNDYQFYGFGVESSTFINSIYSTGDRYLWVVGTSTTARNELMVLKGDGYLGIGTTNPAQKLSVYGNIYQRTGDYITWNNGDAQIGAVSGYALAFSTYTGAAMTEKMRITSNGNVGIGSASPEAKLNVVGGADVLIVEGSGSTANTTIMAVDGNNGRLFEVSDDLSDSLFSVNTIAGLPVMEAFADNRVVLGAYNQCDLVITGSKVGIGTCTPTGGKLHVYNTTGIFEGPGSGASAIDSNTFGIIVGPTHNRSTTSNVYYPGIAFNHLLNYNGGTTYNVAPQGWIGLRLYDTPGSERSSLVFATKQGTGATNTGTDIPTERMCINPFGNVGIGTTNPSTYKLDVAGTIRATGDVIAYSDQRVKENVVTLENSLELVKSLRGVSYNKIGEPEKKVGVIAQEILEVLPEVVQQDSEGMYSVAYGNITAVLIEAIKEQQLQIEELREEIKKLKG